MDLVVVTYNVHECVGRAGPSPERVAEVLHELGPDVAALQEVRALPERGGADDQAGHLARATGLHPVYGRTLTRHDADYGNLLLLSTPAHAVRRYDLGVRGREPRGALDVELEREGRLLRVVATHLGLEMRERRRQVRELEGILATRPGIPTLLLGDFNEWFPSGPVVRRLSRLLRPAPPRGSFPARWPLFPIDRLFTSAGLELSELRRHATPAARSASDHLPIRARLRERIPAA